MRHNCVSMALLFLFLIVGIALPAAADEIGDSDFDSWAMRKSAELDRIWMRSAATETGAAPSTSVRGRMEAPTFRIGRSVWPASGKRSPAGTSLSGSTGIDGSRFTKRGSLDFLWQTTRERNGPSRGISKLESPAKAMRASTFERRLSHNVSSKYRRSTGYSRAAAWRKSPGIGGRISSFGTRSRSSSITRGATRVRRSARTGF